MGSDTRHPQPDTLSPRRILIVRPSALGDVARTVPALVTLKRVWPDAKIDWLVQTPFADVIRHHPDLDTAIGWDRQWVRKLTRRRATFMGGVRFAKALYDTHYDAVYDLQGLLRSGLFAWVTRAPHRVGFADARELGWIGYNVRHHLNGRYIHAVDRMLGLLEADGLAPVRDMRLYAGPEDQAWFAQFHAEHRLDAGYACIAPTARWGCKMWPLDRYAQITRRLLETRAAGDRVVLLASPSERPQVTWMLRDLGDLAERVIFPTTTVGQMMAILSRTRLLVCNDSAPLHIAVGFDRPIVALFGPTNPVEVGPYGKLDSVLQPEEARAARFRYRDQRDDPTLISKITLEEVWAKVEATVGTYRDV